MTKRKPTRPQSATSTSSRTCHSPILILLAALVAVLSTSYVLTTATDSSSLTVQHMQQIFHRPLAALRNAPVFSPLAARLHATFPPTHLRVFTPLHAPSYTKAMGSSATPDSNVNGNSNTPTASTSAFNTIDSDSFHPGSSSNPHENPLPLPAPGDAKALELELGSDGVKLDALGPMVVNKDGTLSRIANWDKMAEIEKKNTLRILGKRNKQRLAALQETNGDDTGS